MSRWGSQVRIKLISSSCVREVVLLLPCSLATRCIAQWNDYMTASECLSDPGVKVTSASDASTDIDMVVDLGTKI